MSIDQPNAPCKDPDPNLLLRLLKYVGEVPGEPRVGLAIPTPIGFGHHEANLALTWCIRKRLLATGRLAGLSDKGVGYLGGLSAQFG